MQSTNEDEQASRSARHRAIAEVLDGKRTLTWDIWASPLYDSHFLSIEGQRVAEWAVDTLQATLGDDFLERVRVSGMGHTLLSPAILTSLWPIIDSRRVYEDLFRLAAQLSLCLPGSKGRSKLQKTMRKNFDQTSWTHCLIQLEMAAFASRAGWAYEFEPPLSTGRPGDLRFDKDGQSIAVEVTSVGMSTPEQDAAAYFHSTSMRLLDIEMRYGVHVTGRLGDAVPDVERDTWIAGIEAAAQATERDRVERYVVGPAEAEVRVSLEAPALGETILEGPGGATDIWGRLNGRVGQKGSRTVGSGTTWIRLQDHAGLWVSMLQAQTTFTERVRATALHLRAMISPFPHVTGLILSPGSMWLETEPAEQTITLPEIPGVVALRGPFAAGRVRETIIVSQSDKLEPDATLFVDWYGQEGTWLDWALEQLGRPHLARLFADNNAPTAR